MMRVLLSVFALLVSTSSYANSHACKDLTGRMYVGIEGQGGEPQDGCEGCGQDGVLEFESDDEVSVVWVGSDIIERCEYRVKKSKLRISCEHGHSIKLKLSRDCNTIKGEHSKFKLAEPSLN